MKRRTQLFVLIIIMINFMGCKEEPIDPIAPVEDPTVVVEPITALIKSGISSGETTAIENITIELEWNEALSELPESLIQMTNAELKSITIDDKVLTIVLSHQVAGSVELIIPAGTLTSETGNTNSRYSLKYNFLPPAMTLTIASTEQEVTSNSPIAVTFEFSTAVSGFTKETVAVSSGQLDNFTGSGKSYQANWSPADEGSLNISVAADVATAIIGGTTNPAALFTVEYDITKPEAVFTCAFENGEITGLAEIPFTITISEEITHFLVTDITSNNSVITDFIFSRNVANFKVTPQTNGAVSISILTDTVKDLADNGNILTEFDFTYDSSTVGILISSTEPSITKTNSFVLNIEFDTIITDLSLSDFSLEGVSLSNLTGSGTSYQLSAAPQQEGDIKISLPSGSVFDNESKANSAASISFFYDSVVPVEPTFTLNEITSDEAIISNSFANEMMELTLTADYSADGGSLIHFAYTLDGLSWNEYSNPIIISDEKIYDTINLKAYDAAGNSISATEISNVTVDRSAPAIVTVLAGKELLGTADLTQASFEISNGEDSNPYFYELKDSDENKIESDGNLDGSGSATLENIDITTLKDGVISVSIFQLDSAGNKSPIQLITIEKDSVKPSQPDITITSTVPVTSTNNDNFSFDVSNGEAGCTYQYRIASTGGGAAFDQTGMVPANNTITVSSLDLSPVRDGTVTVSIFQTDSAGNIGLTSTEDLLLDAVAINIPSFTEDVTPSNEASYRFDLVAEEDSNYSYTINSSGGGVTSSASGTVTGASTIEIGPLDLQSIVDGYLVLSMTITDINGNSSTVVQVVEKSSIAPDTTTADFSAETAEVIFDLCKHSTQWVPSGAVKYDTNQLIGTAFDDRILLSDLEAGEIFIVDGGTGYNILDLKEYQSYNISVVEGVVSENSGTITIDLEGGSTATINYSNISKIIFSSNNFTGSPHAIELDTSDGTQWEFNNTWFKIKSITGDFAIAVLDYEGTLGINYRLATTFQPILDMSNKNGIIIFDYQDADNYKYIRAFAMANKWSIGEVIGGSNSTVASFNETIDETAASPLELRVTGDAGMVAEVWSNDIQKASYAFSDILNDGKFGLTNDIAHTEFTIDMMPSNWAPFAKSYDVIVSHSASSNLQLDLIGDAIDAESENLTLVSISGGTGFITNNGDGTVSYAIPHSAFYGTDSYLYSITDGTNQTTGRIVINVVP